MTLARAISSKFERKLGRLLEWFEEQMGSEVLDPQSADNTFEQLCCREGGRGHWATMQCRHIKGNRTYHYADLNERREKLQ